MHRFTGALSIYQTKLYTLIYQNKLYTPIHIQLFYEATHALQSYGKWKRYANYFNFPLLRQEELMEIKRIRADCEMKVANFIAMSKARNVFFKAKEEEMFSVELLTPAHITEKW